MIRRPRKCHEKTKPISLGDWMGFHTQRVNLDAVDGPEQARAAVDRGELVEVCEEVDALPAGSEVLS